jgi:hypothetical protein
MTFLDSDIIDVLEKVLPSRFGGGPTDFQLFETEREDGSPVLKLLVSPSIGHVDPDVVREVFLDSISKGSDATQLMGLFWRNARLLEVERRPPLATPLGKILHLHISRKDGRIKDR